MLETFKYRSLCIRPMKNEEKLKLIQEVGEEILTLDELKKLLQKTKRPIAYDGFEPSGRMHIAQGLLRAINVNKMTKAGCQFKMWVADWHAWANDKLGGDLDNIKTAGKYLIEVWKASGMNLDKVQFVWCSDFAGDDRYWKTVMQVARNSTVKRIIRCSQIMGRSESEGLSAAQIFYPAMQAADIFHLDIDICQLGMDQRKVNVLARELAPKLGYKKPVAVHHHMLMGLSQPPAQGTAEERVMAMKMSKSQPDSSIFMDDTPEDVERKIGKAYCPAKTTAENPVLEYCNYILFEKFKSIEVKRPAKFGGSTSYTSYEQLAKDFGAGKLHPGDLKPAVALHLNKLLEPVRKHFAKGKPATLLEQVKSFTVTR